MRVPNFLTAICLHPNFILGDLFSNAKLRRQLRKGVKCTTDASRGMERQNKIAGNTSTSSAPTSIHQARKQVRGIANGKHSADMSTNGKKDRTPSNDVFLRNKGSGHRGSRNDLLYLPDTPEKEPMHERARKRAARKSFSPSASPSTIAVADIVQERLAKNDPVLVHLCNDMNPQSSQEALDYCMRKVKRMKRDD